MTVKLNLGAGDVAIEGFTPIDRKFGTEVYPLDNYADNSVEEIRASHILEHFPRNQVQAVLKEWVRVLKPGGRLRIAVPDFDKIVAARDDPKWFAYLMGGQTNDDDYHKSIFTRETLHAAMSNAGLATICGWQSDNTDCASLPISLNLEGEKLAVSDSTPQVAGQVRVKALMTVPRYGSLAARGIAQEALHDFGLPLETTQGVFWGQQMQRMLEQSLKQNVEWALTLDYDSVFTREHLQSMFDTFGNNEEMDALVAMQPRREGETPLMTVGGKLKIETDWKPILVTTAHFGLALIRVKNLAGLPKPWFKSVPDDQGEWGPSRKDDDIYFWHNWRKAGSNIYVDPKIRIGHLEECVSYFDDDLKVQRCSVSQWRDKHGMPFRKD